MRRLTWAGYGFGVLRVFAPSIKLAPAHLNHSLAMAKLYQDLRVPVETILREGTFGEDLLEGVQRERESDDKAVQRLDRHVRAQRDRIFGR